MNHRDSESDHWTSKWSSWPCLYLVAMFSFRLVKLDQSQVSLSVDRLFFNYFFFITETKIRKNLVIWPSLINRRRQPQQKLSFSMGWSDKEEEVRIIDNRSNRRQLKTEGKRVEVSSAKNQSRGVRVSLGKKISAHDDRKIVSTTSKMI